MQNLKVLVVDDTPEIRDVLMQRLTAHGYGVQTCENAEDALGALGTDRFDVVITDLKMPGQIDGIGLLDTVKQRYPDTEVMIMTGYATVETAVEALRKGAVDYFIKPFNFDEILEWLRRITKKREVLAALRHTEHNKEQGFSDLWDIINSLYATCSKIEKILRDDHESEHARIEKALRLLSLRAPGSREKHP